MFYEYIIDIIDGKPKYISVRACQTLIFDNVTGLFNVTKFCESVNKKFEKYLMLPMSDKVYNALKEKCDLEISSVQDTYLDEHKEVNGVYYHPILLMHVAMWCGKKCFVNVVHMVLELFHSTHRLCIMYNQLNHFVSYGHHYTYFSKVTRITYDGLEVFRNKHGYYNAVRFNPRHNDFKTSRQIIKQIRHLIKRDPIERDVNGHVYYHPILFLMYVNWVDESYLQPIAQIIMINYEKMGPATNFARGALIEKKRKYKHIAQAQDVTIKRLKTDISLLNDEIAQLKRGITTRLTT
jgi:hypothetical protein